MRVHLVDGTYELFRYYFALPSHLTDDGVEVNAVRGVVGSMLDLLDDGATHVGIATDHVIESFRNELWPRYKTGEGIDPALLGQFPLLEEALEAVGFCVWPMIEYEADDALASAAAVADADERVEQVVICTPDKDLGQCVKDSRVVQYDRRKRELRDEAGVGEKFGVAPVSIPDYLALVGDSADGFPGLPGWGAKSTAAVLARYKHLEAIPAAAADWDIGVRNAGRLAKVLQEQFEEALLFRTLARLDLDAPTIESVDELEWAGPRPELIELAERMDATGLAERAVRLATARFG